MKQSLLLLVLLLAPHSALATTCVFVPLERQLDEADIAFIATITEATSSGSFGPLRTGDEYRVNYSFEVRERLKGDPSVVPSLFTRNTYHAHDSDLSFDGDETRLLPGDNVLVLTSSPGEAQVASCTPSRIWSPTQDQLQLLRSPGSALLTIRSSRTCFATPTTWQIKLATSSAPLRKSA